MRFHGRGYKSLQFIVFYENKTYEVEDPEFLENLIMIDQNNSALLFDFTLEENHVYVIDECSRVTYIIVPPWR